jgi:ribA/ribD-fused uncharacterized protein
MDVAMDAATYDPAHSAAFMRSRDRYGDMSNMTFGFPLSVNGLEFQGPEGLYQALKFPGSPETQRAIASQRSGMDAKKAAYRDHNFRPDWEEVKVQAMRYTLAVKLRQHPRRFGEALAETGDLPIVERSNRDPFWGARPQGNILAGVNTLGKLLTELRDTLGENGGDAAKAANAFAAQVPAERLRVNGRPVPPEVPAREARGPDGRDGANEANGSNDANRKNAPAPRAHRAPRAAGNRIQF